MEKNRVRRQFVLIFLAIILLSVSHSIASAHAMIQWKVGDEVEVKQRSGDWVRARIIKIEDFRATGKGFHYRVHVYDAQGKNTEWAAKPDSIRAPLKEMDPDGVST
ncbi:MAG TPA: hypothetical protein VKB86_21545 [Pyrinomonadaceae bacterium]|nr:hypothetical protein [Pyrinomonadaceae bacterium]